MAVNKIGNSVYGNAGRKLACGSTHGAAAEGSSDRFALIPVAAPCHLAS